MQMATGQSLLWQTGNALIANVGLDLLPTNTDSYGPSLKVKPMNLFRTMMLGTCFVVANSSFLAGQVEQGTLARRSKGTVNSHSFETISIPSEDGLAVTVDVYANVTTKGAPFLLLCHQAGWSRGEYREIGPKLNKLGFNCAAIDQRSGGEVNDVVNQTVKEAKAAGKDTGFVVAEQDMIAALKWARKTNPSSKVILWGSSYSAALALRIAGEHPDLIDGLLAFAPGEYFVRFGKPGDWITTSAAKIKAPVFITSAKNEAQRWMGIFDAISSKRKSKFVPETAGNHGSRALWVEFADSDTYWEHVERFLKHFDGSLNDVDE